MRRQVLVIVETSYAYGRSVLRGINEYLVAHESWSVSLDFRGLMMPPPAWLADWAGDGVISRSSDPDMAELVRRRGLPAIDLTDIRGDLGLPRIWADHAAVGAMAAAHLLERGFSRFAFCGFSGHAWSAARRDGFRNAVAGIADRVETFETQWDPRVTRPLDEGYDELCGWLASLPKPVGVMACNDLRGQHVLDACRRLGLAVPEEVAVIGVDNDELLCRLCDPPLSSIIPDAERIGYEAAAALDALMRAEPLGWEERVIPPAGIATRQSTDVLAIDDPLVAAAVRMIRQQACTGISVEDVLHEIPLSRSMLERRFRKYVGRSPQSEIRHVRLKRVRQLLLETDLTLERIAQLTGFEHPEYLSVVFRREMNETPGKYRNRLRIEGLRRVE